MEMKLKGLLLLSIIAILILQLGTSAHSSEAEDPPTPTPRPWPERFHALFSKNFTSGPLQIADMWYDWPRGRNVNIIQKQLGDVLYNIEWNNGTSFYYTLGSTTDHQGTCHNVHYGIGIPRPDFLAAGANYLGTQVADGFLCNVWEKLDFISYFEDVITKRPVRWDFFDGISAHVITFEVGAELQDTQILQAPAYCFSEEKGFESV